jgi:hypothetical protein
VLIAQFVDRIGRSHIHRLAHSKECSLRRYSVKTTVSINARPSITDAVTLFTFHASPTPLASAQTRYSSDCWSVASFHAVFDSIKSPSTAISGLRRANSRVRQSLYFSIWCHFSLVRSMLSLANPVMNQNEFQLVGVNQAGARKRHSKLHPRLPSRSWISLLSPELPAPPTHPSRRRQPRQRIYAALRGLLAQRDDGLIGRRIPPCLEIVHAVEGEDRDRS